MLTAVYLVLAEPILVLFGADVNPETFAMAKEYFFWIALGIPFYMFSQAMNPVIRADGSIVIAIQATDPGDPTVNWLPSPPSGGLRLSLRLYLPSRAARTGKWRPPGLVKVG